MNSEDRFYTVYKHTVLANGKVYIGITAKRPEDRWVNGRGYLKQPYFARAIAKYGWENIKHEILFTKLTMEEAEEKEKELIAEYGANNPEKGYNIAKGGLARKPTHKFTNAIPVRCLDNDVVYDTIADAARSLDLKTSAIRSCLLGIYSQTHGFHFDYANEEDRKPKVQRMTKKEAALNAANKALAYICKPVKQFDLLGNFIGQFVSTREAERILGIDHSRISECCLGKRKTASGYCWQYA